MKHWIAAARLRTLPLAASSIITGSTLAPEPDWLVFGMALLTTFMLQVLSNFANDYGDHVHGADHAGRVGPGRQVQQGTITAQAMKKAMILIAVACMISGLTLLLIAFGPDQWQSILGWTALGIVCIAAAITYTAGKNPYGYKGFGDLAVLIFFGWVGVGGSYFLQTMAWDWTIMMPATAMGLLSVGVLNLNNIRDMESDRKAGKFSLALRLGWPGAGHYHAGLLGMAWLLLTTFFWSQSIGFRLLVFLGLLGLLLGFQVWQVYQKGPGQGIDPFLKRLALTALGISLLVGGLG
jgi:1,4-dihydroxy-2-naphthoate polyprenyltransferase